MKVRPRKCVYIYDQHILVNSLVLDIILRCLALLVLLKYCATPFFELLHSRMVALYLYLEKLVVDVLLV